MTIEVNHYEATVLSLIERMQPVTAYQVRKKLAQSPTLDISASTGKIYPIVRRLKERGLLVGDSIDSDLRRTERLTCTEQGRQALRLWIGASAQSHLLPEDPLRTRILSLHLLSHAEQLRWLQSVRDDLANLQDQLRAFAKQHPGPVEDLAHANAQLTTAARIAWIDQVLKTIRRSKLPAPGRADGRAARRPR